ncbi:hypothetical protein A2U01_0001350 [Trifolium medium]|uniref:Uncharacterized protein n=1 Tax=Trifolium medium TaxID=97028 RepID=A0A392LZY0_9FABA|nr:hypothetical protein [Trifolium medium]
MGTSGLKDDLSGLETFELKEELAAQKLRSEAMEAQLDEVVVQQKEMASKISSMADKQDVLEKKMDSFNVSLKNLKLLKEPVYIAFPLKSFRSCKASDTEEHQRLSPSEFGNSQTLDSQTLCLQTLMAQRFISKLTKRKGQSTKVTIMAVGAVALLSRMCRHYPLRQSFWSDYYPVCNRFKLHLQKANSKFQRAPKLLNGHLQRL